MSRRLVTESAKGRYLLEYARGASHEEAGQIAGASRRSFNTARREDPDFDRALRLIYEARLAGDWGERVDLIAGLRAASVGLANAADRLERDTEERFSYRAWLSGNGDDH
jgi:hypothetical protein